MGKMNKIIILRIRMILRYVLEYHLKMFRCGGSAVWENLLFLKYFKCKRVS